MAVGLCLGGAGFGSVIACYCGVQLSLFPLPGLVFFRDGPHPNHTPRAPATNPVRANLNHAALSAALGPASETDKRPSEASTLSRRGRPRQQEALGRAVPVPASCHSARLARPTDQVQYPALPREGCGRLRWFEARGGRLLVGTATPLWWDGLAASVEKKAFWLGRSGRPGHRIARLKLCGGQPSTGA